MSVCSPGAAGQSSGEAPAGFVGVAEDGQRGLCAGLWVQHCQQQEALMKCSPLSGCLGAVTSDCGSCIPGAVQLPVHSSALSGMSLLMGAQLWAVCAASGTDWDLWSCGAEPPSQQHPLL